MTKQRYAIYRAIHKAVRHLLFSTSHRIGLTDFADPVVTLQALAAVDQTVAFLREHRKQEDAHIHPATESRAPGITARFAQEHEEDDRLIKEIEQLVVQMRGADRALRADLGIELHERFNAYIGIYLGHLYREETQLQQVLWDHFTDEELIAMAAAITADISPKCLQERLVKMCMTCNPDELFLILNHMKTKAPPEIFQGMAQLAEGAMEPAIWKKVQGRMDKD